VNSSRYDVIVFTARKEEQFFLEKLLNPSEDQLYPRVQRVEPNKLWDDLQIGLVTLGSMGNVTTAITAFEVMERVLPRCVVMIGLAGAYKPANGTPNLRKGDIGLGSQIFYHSFGKIRDRSPFHEIRDKPLDVPAPIGWEWVDSKIHEWAFMQKVQKLVEEWYKDPKFDVVSWLREAVDVNDQNKYNNQIPPDSNITAAFVNVASGEQVIANSKYVEQVRGELKLKNISLFEMESFGLGNVCHKFNVPFYLIKGVSDYADAPAPWFNRLVYGDHRGKDDKSRWRAIAGASALFISLLKDGLRSHILNQSRPERPGAGKLVNCLHPNGEIPCPHCEDSDRNIDLRKCIRPGLNLRDATAAWLCRTFEDMKPGNYSTKLESAVTDLVKKEKAKVTTFFPYTARDLLELSRRQNTIEHNELLGDILNDESEMADRLLKLKRLAESFRKTCGHFHTFDDVCKTEGITETSFGKGQPAVARIVLLEGWMPSNDDSIVKNPLNAIYPLLLGTNVPTYYASAENLIRDGSACTPDVTFIDRQSLPVAIGKYEEVVALRFFEDSNTLLVSGLPCSDVADKVGSRVPQSLRQLYSLWTGWCGGSLPTQHFFAPFPLGKIIQEYKL
jgi:nucleoside phosphorylase